MESKHVKHIAIIADGNRRWAKANGKSRTEGHLQGEKNYETISKAIWERGIEYFTIFGFSTENWTRSQEEVSTLMELFRQHLIRYGAFSATHNYRIRIIGSRENLTPTLLEAIDEVERRTQHNTGLKIQIAFNYGGRDEIVRAALKLNGQITDGVLTPGDVNEQIFGGYMDTGDIPAPEIVIRTGGERRLSNFLLWQMAYSELFFVERCWPDFSRDDLNEIIESFEHRSRRFGGA